MALVYYGLDVIIITDVKSDVCFIFLPSQFI